MYLYIIHVQSHTSLPEHLAQSNAEIDQLLIGSVLQASEFHKKHHVNSNGLKKKNLLHGNKLRRL